MIAQVLNVGSFFLDIAKQLYPESSDIGAAAAVTDRARNAYNVVNTSSVHRSAYRTVIAPMVVIDKGLLHQEYMQDLITVLNLRDIVATLSHLALQNSVGVGVKVEALIGSINPNRAGMLSMLSGLEAMDTNIRPKKDGDDTPKTNHVQVGNKTIPDLLEYVPLAVGRVVTATLYGENGRNLEVPLTFRQIPVPVDEANMMHLFSAVKGEDGLKMRWMMKRTGEITNPEWLNGTDIIRNRFKAKMGDASGYYAEAMRRDTSNTVEAIRTGVISVNSMANAIIISSDEAAQIELATGKRFTNPTSRQQIFEKLSANTIVICNDDRGSYMFYTDGQTMGEDYTRRDLAVKSKKEGSANTLQDLVKLLNGGM